MNEPVDVDDGRPQRPMSTPEPDITYVRSLCHHHAEPLLTIAVVLLEDVDLACEIVAETLAAAYRDGRPAPTEPRTRTRLARSVYHRCLGQLAARERFPQLSETRRSQPRPDTLFDHLGIGQRAILSLTLFGRHTVAQLADTMRMSPATGRYAPRPTGPGGI